MAGNTTLENTQNEITILTEAKVNIDQMKDIATNKLGGVKTEEQFLDLLDWYHNTLKDRGETKVYIPPMIEAFSEVLGDRFYYSYDEKFNFGFDPYVPSLSESGLTVKENLEQNFGDIKGSHADLRQYTRWIARQEDFLGIDPNGGDMFIIHGMEDRILEIMEKYLPDETFTIEHLDDE